MSKELSKEDIIRIAADAGAKAGIEQYEEHVKRQKRKKIDARLRNTKKLMRHYQEIKIHASDAITSLSEIGEEDYDFFQGLMEERSPLDVNAIITAKARSAIMLAHIDTMIGVLEQISFASKDPNDARRYRVLEAMCIADPPYTVQEIADREAIDVRTVYRDYDFICDRLSALLFGIQGITEE